MIEPVLDRTEVGTLGADTFLMAVSSESIAADAPLAAVNTGGVALAWSCTEA